MFKLLGVKINFKLISKKTLNNTETKKKKTKNSKNKNFTNDIKLIVII